MEPKPTIPSVWPSTMASGVGVHCSGRSIQISGCRLAAEKMAARANSASATADDPRAEVTTGPSNSQGG